MPQCAGIREMFSGYLDGAINGRDMQAIAIHLEACPVCHHEFETYRGMQGMLSAVGSVTPPTDLGIRLRIAISHENAKRQGHWWDGIALAWSNALRPALLKISVGAVSALALLGSIGALIGFVAAPGPVQANDEPLGAMSAPHYLYSAVLPQPIVTGQDTTILVAAKVNAAGRIYDYNILSGPQDPATLSQIRDQIMVQVYEPARVFGEPVRGHVLITFAGVSVRG